MSTSTPLTIPAASNAEGAVTPDGVYICTLEEMQPWKSENPQFGDDPQVKWIFRIDSVRDTEGDDPAALINQSIWGFTTLKMGKKATMRAWVEGLLGRELADGERVNPTDLIGITCKIVFGVYTKRDGSKGHRILSVVGAKKSAAPPPPPPASTDTGDDFPF